MRDVFMSIEGNGIQFRTDHVIIATGGRHQEVQTKVKGYLNQAEKALWDEMQQIFLSDI